MSVSSSRAAVTTAGGFTRAAVTLDTTVCGLFCVGEVGPWGVGGGGGCCLYVDHMGCKSHVHIITAMMT